jgi:hypothetical protein
MNSEVVMKWSVGDFSTRHFSREVTFLQFSSSLNIHVFIELLWNLML